jgi:ABC-type branched-subunit amino acid transport system permease subunit
MNSVIVGGIFSLAGVCIGALLVPVTQLYIERSREEKAARRAKLLVAAELLQVQLIFRTTWASKVWPYAENASAAEAAVPSAARSSHRTARFGFSRA